MAIKINGTNTAAAPGITGDDTDTGLVYGTNQVDVSTGGTSRVTFDSGGRLLVGTTSNTSPIGWGNNLQVAGTGAAAGVSIRRDENGTGGALLVFGKTRGSLNGSTVVQSGDQIGGMYFAGGDGTDVNSIAAQIAVEVDGTPGSNDMPGRILVKTTADGSASATERLRIASDGRITQITGDLVIDQSNNGYGGLRILDSTAGEYSVNYIAGRNSGATAHVFSIGGRTQNSSPWANATQSECARISQRGISFNGDDAQANALDDYEEGTWTPNPHDGSVTSAVAKYRKIGNIVTIWAQLHSFSDTSTNDQIRIKGLPYNPSSSWYGAVGSAMIQNVSEDAGWMAFAQTDQVRFYASSTGGYDQLRHNELSSSHEIYFCATYPVN